MVEQPARNGFRIEENSTRTPWEVRHHVEIPPRESLPRGGGGATIAFGLERRLPRRAETMWEQLATDGGLPPAHATAPFQRPPFGGNAMQLRACLAGATRIETIGEGLQSITQLARGVYRADDGGVTELGRQIVELARSALAGGMPLRLESERMSQRPSAGRPHLLLRAVALPFAADATGERPAVVVTSWRKLLSAEETAALHRELAAAMDWMHRQRPRE